jgi:hypothetical protein
VVFIGLQKLIYLKVASGRIYLGAGLAVSHLQGWLSDLGAGVPARSRYQYLTWRQYRAFRVKVLENKVPEKVEPVRA